MNIEFRKSFARDLKRRKREKELLSQVQEAIQEVDNADSPTEITNLRKLKAAGNCYRIRIGDYRIGLSVEGDTVCFVRLLHRRDIYRYFP